MILVTGATGKNGTEILKRLAARRERIRAMVRKRNEMMAITLHSEPEFVEGDFDDTTSLRKALAGVQRAFLVTNSSERVEERQLRFVSLAREAGVKHIVYLSQLHASLESPLRFLPLPCSRRRGASHVGYELHQPSPEPVYARLAHDWQVDCHGGPVFCSRRRCVGKCS